MDNRLGITVYALVWSFLLKAKQRKWDFFLIDNIEFLL